MLRNAAERGRSQSKSEERLVEKVLADPDISLLLKGIEAHDRSGDLDAVYERDIRRKVQEVSSGRLSRLARRVLKAHALDTQTLGAQHSEREEAREQRTDIHLRHLRRSARATAVARIPSDLQQVRDEQHP
jgi:hypothetical protein